MQTHSNHTRRVPCSKSEVQALLNRLYASEAVPDHITRYTAREDRLVVYGRVRKIKPISLEVTTALLTVAAQQETIISPEELIEGFAVSDDQIVLLVGKEDDGPSISLTIEVERVPSKPSRKLSLLAISTGIVVMVLFSLLWLL